MTNQLTDSFKVKVPKGMTMWDVVARLSDAARRAVGEFPGQVHDEKFVVGYTSGVLVGSTIAELQQQVESREFKVDRVDYFVSVAPPGSSPWTEDLGVVVSGPLDRKKAGVLLQGFERPQLAKVRALIESDAAALTA